MSLDVQRIPMIFCFAFVMGTLVYENHNCSPFSMPVTTRLTIGFDVRIISLSSFAKISSLFLLTSNSRLVFPINTSLDLPSISVNLSLTSTNCRLLFYGYRFRQIAWLINIGAFDHSHVIGQQLYRNGIDQRRNERVHFRHFDCCQTAFARFGQTGSIGN